MVSGRQYPLDGTRVRPYFNILRCSLNSRLNSSEKSGIFPITVFCYFSILYVCYNSVKNNRRDGVIFTIHVYSSFLVVVQIAKHAGVLFCYGFFFFELHEL